MGHKGQFVEWAMSAVAFFSFCRSGDLTVATGRSFDPREHLTLEDLVVDNQTAPSIVALQLKKTKMDPFMKGVRVTVGHTGAKSVQ